MNRIRTSLGAKLLVAQLLVVIAGSITLLLVAITAGPWLFDRHLDDRLADLPATAQHVEAAFRDALATALVVAIVVASTTAVAMSVLLTRRVAIPVRRLTDGASRIAEGRYDARVQVTGEDELAALAESFNAMAQALADTERTRTRLITDVAHELRTPLATLDGYLEGLAEGVIPPDDHTWETLRSQTRRMARLAEDLALVSRAAERRLNIRPEPTDAAELIAAATHAIAPLATAREVALTSSTTPSHIPVHADPDRMQQVLGNLLENALHHTPAGGHVHIASEQTPSSVRITVADNGEGIPPDELELVFTRFHRVDSSRTATDRGSGIGLTLARAIIAEHDGKIVATSRGPGTGSTFTITLPSRKHQ